MLVHWIWFAMLSGLNGRQKISLLQQYANPEDLYDLPRQAEMPPTVMEALRNKDLTRATAIQHQCTQKGIGILTFFDSTYPELLRRIDDPPLVLYYQGHLPDLSLRPAIGIVGTRKASPYGLRAAASLGAQIAACGGVVISGGAQGIDTLALQGALENGGTTVAVMAGGLDHLYPATNKALFKRILDKGCLLSEYPPGERCYPGNFLHRNRIISGIGNGVLVVEAPRVSGALNTARWANEQGRDVFAVPGNIDVESCAGSNALLGDIARPALNGWMVLKEYAYLYPETVAERKILAPVSPQETPEKPVPAKAPDKKTVDKERNCPYSVKEKPMPALSEQEKAVAELLGQTPIPVDQLMDQLDIPPAEIMNIVTRLTLKGVAQSHPGKLVSLKFGG